MIAPHRGRTTAGSWRWALPALLLLLPFLAWALGALVWRAAAPEGVRTAATLLEVARDRTTWERLAFTGGQAFASMLLALLLGVPAAYVVARTRVVGRRALRLALTLPLALPSIVVALGFREALAPGGWVAALLGGADVLDTPWPVVAAHACYGVAIVVTVLAPAWARMDARPLEAARLLGAGRLQMFRHVTLPLLMRPLAAAAALAFAFAFTSFAIVLVLGAPRYDTLEVAVYRAATEGGRLPTAAALALLQLAITVVALALSRVLPGASSAARAGAVGLGLAHHAPRARRGIESLAPASRGARAWRVLLVLLAWATALALVILPLAALVDGALHDAGAFTTAHFTDLVGDVGDEARVGPRAAAAWTLTLALATAALATLTGGAAAFAIARSRGRIARVLNAALWLPAAVSAVTVALGLTLALARWGDAVLGTPWPLLLAHTLVAYPVVLYIALPRVRALHAHAAEAAALLGASPWAVWRRLELPSAAPTLAVGAVFVFVISLGESGATLLLATRDVTTLPAAIARGIEDGGDAGPALAMATIVAATAVIAFLVIERLRKRATEY